MPPVTVSPCLSEKEAASYLSVSLSTLRRWRRAKNGPAYFRFGGVLRYGRSEYKHDFLEQLRQNQHGLPVGEEPEVPLMALFSKGVSWPPGCIPSVLIPSTPATNTTIQNA